MPQLSVETSLFGVKVVLKYIFMDDFKQQPRHSRMPRFSNGFDMKGYVRISRSKGETSDA